MNTFLKFCAIVSIVVATIKLALIGNMAQGMTTFIIIAALFILVGNKTITVITVAVAGVVLFIKIYGSNNTALEANLLQSILTLSIICFGFFLILRGLFPSAGRRRRY